MRVNRDQPNVLRSQNSPQKCFLRGSRPAFQRFNAWSGGDRSLEGLPGFSDETAEGATKCERRAGVLNIEMLPLLLDVIRLPANGPEEDTTYPLTNSSQVLTTSSIVGRLPGLAAQHLSMNFHISAVSPSCTAACGLAGLFPLAIWITTDSFFMFPNGTFPVNTSTASIANAKMSAGLDAVGGLEFALPGGSIISGASHREDPAAPGVAATVNMGFDVMGLRP